MKMHKLLLLILMVTGWHAGPPGDAKAQVRVGADLSFLPKLESMGAAYLDEGVEMNCLDIFHDHDWQIVRLRLWHTPDPENTWNGLDSTLAFAQRIKQAGFELMLDFHYSDWWADPGQQNKPAAWEDLDYATLVDSVREYSANVLQRFIDADAVPDYVQAGNEISPGMLFPEGRVGWQGSEWDTPLQWAQLTGLLTAAIEGITQHFMPAEEPSILLHIADGANNWHSRWWFDHVTDAGVEFDVIAFSYYPWWHGTSLTALQDNLEDMIDRYDKPVMIVESNYPFTLDWNDNTHNMVGMPDQLIPGFPASEHGQLIFYQAVVSILDDLPSPGGLGFLLWEPAYIAFPGGPGSPMENLCVFDFDGEALLGLELPLTLGVPEDPYEPVEYRKSIPATGFLHPNPANAATVLTLPDGILTETRVQLVDMLGRSVHQTQLAPVRGGGAATLTIPLEGLSSGRYWVVIRGADPVQIQPLTILR